MAFTVQRRRTGSIAVMAALVMVVVFAMFAFALDLGYIQVTRTQLQRSADAAAVAAAWELIDEEVALGLTSATIAKANARSVAGEYAGQNWVLRDQPTLANSDVEIGYLANPSDPNEQLDTSGTSPPNAIRVRVRRAEDQNGSVPLLFGSMMGVGSTSAQCEATAAFMSNFGGFRAPADGTNLGMLPFALDEDTWNNMLAGYGTDNWGWNDELQELVSGPDGILEVNLFPQGTGSPGNRGTVDIGSSNNSTADIARQIMHGVSAADLAHHGGSLVFDQNGFLFLNGDTGISAGVKDELESIKGEPRIIPIFREVNGPGNNAVYTIVKFVGVRIMNVKLTGKMSGKQVIIQPAAMVTKGGLPPASNGISSYYIYSAPWLVR